MLGTMNVLVAAVVVSLAITTVTSEAIRNFSLHEADIPTLTEREASSDNPSIIASVLNDGDSYGEPPLTLDASPPPEESSDVEEHSRTYDVLYQQGIDHYLSDDWHQCVSYIQLAIKDHRWYRDTLVSCRRDCRAEALSSTPLAVHRNNAQEFYETTIKNALCLLKCRQKYFSGRHQHVAALNVDRDFAIRKPYDYLQLCLFKTGRVQDAANAAVTVLAVQPTHTVMTNNLRQYIEDYDADKDLLENLELQEYAREYVRGDHAHSAEDFTRSVEHMEAALALYWRALEDCRLMCEEPFDQGWFPDFVSSVANHYTFTFRCKRKCGAQLSNLYGEEIENFLPSMLNYLQYGYQKLDQIPKACSAVESYLELLPADASMLRNKQYYLSNYQKVDRHFVVRKEIAEHAAKERYEERLLNFIDTEFVFLEEDRSVIASQLHLQEEELEAGDEVEDSVVGKHKIISGGQTTTKEVKQPAGEDQERNGKTQAPSQKDQMPPEKYQVSSEEDRSSAEENQFTGEKNQRVNGKHTLPAGDQFSPEERKAPAVKEGKTKNKLQPVLVFNAEQLNGTRRYVVDNLISDIKCKILTTLIHVAGEQGDGYHRNINPHTEAEDFLGLTLSRAGLMVHAGLLEPELLQLVLQVTATAKRQLVQHFQLVEPLYFSYTHLVCRTAKPEYYGSRVDGDMSHVVHVDNCIMYSPSECHQRPPAYTFRDYSAIVYLNHDFQGGEFVFTTDPRGEDVQSSVQSKCGRMVGFSAGPENPHGVRAVLRGSRCAVALWFTHDEKHKDKERILAETLLNKIKSGEIKVK